MSATVLTDAQGKVVSIGTVVASPLPAGLTANTISDADFDAIRQGLKKWSDGSVIDTGLLVSQQNQALVVTAITQAIIDMQAILDSAAVPAGTMSTATLSSVARQLEGAVRSMALRLKQCARLLNGDFSGSA